MATEKQKKRLQMKERFDKMFDLLFIRKRKLEIISTAKKKLSTAKRKLNFNQGVSEFKNKVKEKPYYIFVACNKCLYKKYVK